MRIRQSIYIVLGSLFLGIGVVGIFLPLLPTTPFLLLASFFYMRSSKKLHNWLIANRVLGLYIKNYIDGKGVPTKVKMFTVLLLWAVIIASVVVVVDELVLRVILAIVAIGVSWHIVLIKGNKEG